MRIQKQGDCYVIRLDPGEELMNSLLGFAAGEKIEAGELRAIGALKDFELGYFLIDEKKYIRKIFSVNSELLSCLGNLAIKEGKPFAHIHIAAGLPDYSVVGGHFFSGIVTATVEIIVWPFPVRMERAFDQRTGLYLLDLPCGETS